MMSKDEIKKKVSEWVPDTPEEIAQIGSAINRLGLAMATVGAFQDKMLWVLITLGVTWLGHEISQYFIRYTQNRQEPKP